MRVLFELADTVLKSEVLDETVLKATEVVASVPEAPEVPLQTGYPD